MAKDKLMSVAKKMYKGSGAKSIKGMHRPEGAGNFDNMDDFNIVDSININTGTIQQTPIDNVDIVNKSYVDTAIAGLTLNHDELNNLTWSTAGHTIDTDLTVSDSIIGGGSFYLKGSGGTRGGLQMTASGDGPEMDLTNLHWTGFTSTFENQSASQALIIKSANGEISFDNENLTTTGDIQATTANLAGMDISNDGVKTTFLGKSGDYNRIGDGGVTSSGLSSNDDLLVTGKLEVNGDNFVDGTMAMYGGFDVKGPIYNFLLGRMDPDQYKFCVGKWGDPGPGKNIVFTDEDWRGRDFDHAAQANPTIWIHSSTDPNSDNTQWISLTHDQTDGRIEVGTGKIKTSADVESAGDVQGATLTAGDGFTGTGAYTNFTIVNGIITAAS